MHQSAWISICSAGLPARCSACLATHLAMHLAIWLLGCISACLVACLSVWRSARLLVDSSGCTWQRVWSYFGLVNNLSALLPVLQAAHPVAHFLICRSVLLPAGCNFVHLPVPQARCQSVSSSANLAGRAPIWRIFCSISCNWQHVYLPAGSPSAGRGPIRSSISLGHYHFRRLNRFQHICVIANLLSRPRANSGQSTHTHSSPGINLRHQAVSSPHMLAS